MRLRLIAIIALISIILLPILAQEQPELIMPGTILGEITDLNPTDRYTFEGIGGQQITITMEATDNSALDSALSLFDPNGSLMQTDDDSAGNRNARIIFEPQTNGIFTIEATRYQLNPPLTTGTYQLTLSVSGNETSIIDPFAIPPDFSVQFTNIALNETTPASFTTGDDLQYYVIGAEQGDFIRVELTNNDSLTANVRVLTRINQTLTEISRIAQNSPTRDVVFVTIPQTGWYLVEVEREAGIGGYTLTPTRVSDTLLTENTPVETTLANDGELLSFVFNGTINERIFINLTVRSGNNLQPEITILDLNRNQLAQETSQGSQVRASLNVPRSSPYIVEIRNLGTGTGDIAVQLRRIAIDISKLPVREVEYNESYTGTIDDSQPIEYFRFTGKAGELVTVSMDRIANSGDLDPYLILADATLNELIFNDNASASRSARIAQFALPADGDYFILATRTGLSRGNTDGQFDLAITVGELRLETGPLTATLTWQGEADLNLFVRTPDGHTISWANPDEPTGGNLQIDSNTGCETPSAQPIEHILWDTADQLKTGDYTIWVWYQNDCMMAGETPFTLTVNYDNTTILVATSTELQQVSLQPDERFEASIRLTDSTAFVVNPGSYSIPSDQQTESQGGDQLIVYGDTVSGSITDEVFAQFYQFEGSAGDTIAISVNRITNDLDPIVILRTDLDVNLATNDDISPTNRNSQLIYTLENDGRYVIAITRYGLRDGTTTGTYSLSLSRIAVPE